MSVLKLPIAYGQEDELFVGFRGWIDAVRETTVITSEQVRSYPFLRLTYLSLSTLINLCCPCGSSVRNQVIGILQSPPRVFSALGFLYAYWVDKLEFQEIKSEKKIRGSGSKSQHRRFRKESNRDAWYCSTKISIFIT